MKIAATFDRVLLLLILITTYLLASFFLPGEISLLHDAACISFLDFTRYCKEHRKIQYILNVINQLSHNFSAVEI